jgi:hypothetical protein
MELAMEEQNLLETRRTKDREEEGMEPPSPSKQTENEGFLSLEESGVSLF